MMTQTIACTCGQVQIEVEKAPIASAECHCTSCRAAAARLQMLPGAPRFTEANGGTHYPMYRKDRVRFLTGTDWLKEFRLTPTSTTRRVIATCCNTPVFLEFRGGHWLSLYACLWPKGTLPPLELRTMTSDLADASFLSDDVPNGKRQSFAFYAKLLGAWIAMGFKVPKITCVSGEIHA